MDFEIIVGRNGKGEKKIRLGEISQTLQFIERELAQWNNFEAEKEFNILVRKVENDTETLGLYTKDIIDTRDNHHMR